MKILLYDSNTKSLSIQYSTKAVWEYSPVSEKLFEILKKSSEEVIKNTVRSLNLVGVYKKGN